MILVTGFVDETIDLGGGALPDGPFLVKLDENGEHLLSRSVPFAGKIALDPAGNIVVAGDGLAGLDATGAVLWTRPLGAPVTDLILFPLGAIAIAGVATAPLDFGDGPLAHAGGSDVFVATFNP
ncbi:hypothetical protein WME99_33215 [Sorangium sp. So ce136]|uniref:hypothetical protein n=1 Tax=Sorangium sp. So ce136 TaxID=3133284 RepID=UPI003EFCC862